MKRFKDYEHLFRFALLWGFLIVSFFVARHFVVPKSFGEYGHYRGDAIADVASHPVRFAGQQRCETCHSDVATVKHSGIHAGVHCEACHGPLARHADDPGNILPAKLDTAILCVRCHAASAAKPKNFPQVAAADHSGGVACETCHQPHSPALPSGGAN